MGRTSRRVTAEGNIDSILLSSIYMLVILGIVMIFSSSAIMAEENFGSIYFFVIRQFLWVFIGTAVLILGLSVDYKKWAHFSKFGMLIVFVMLCVVLIPSIGHKVGYARRWIRFGGIGFQPAELAKIMVVIYVASILDRKYAKIESFHKDLVPPMILVLVIMLLIYKQPDFGTSVIILLSLGGMFFLGGVKLKHLIMGIMFFIPFIIYALFTFSYRKERVLSFLNPFEYMYGSGFQLAHSIMALGDGGLKGLGLGSGYHKLFFIPEVHNDFIFAIIGQELGFIGTTAVLVLFVIFAWRGISISLKQKDYLAKILAAGLTFLISIQAIINIGVVTGCLPTKGLSLPFVSFGGSSMMFNMFAVGIILNISKKAK